MFSVVWVRVVGLLVGLLVVLWVGLRVGLYVFVLVGTFQVAILQVCILRVSLYVDLIVDLTFGWVFDFGLVLTFFFLMNMEG